MIGNKKRDPDYEKWLEETGKSDTRLNREWFYCPEEKRAEFIKKHKAWWDKF